MELKKIKVGERFRKDLGDLEGLKNSIKEIGLLQPIVVDEKNNLIAGYRRLEAHKELGRKEIAVNVINLESSIKGEYAENAIRKDFAPSEAVAIWQAMESRQGLRGKLPLSENKKRREIAAQTTKIGYRSLSKAQAVVEFGDKKLIEKMDRTGNVDASYKVVRTARNLEKRKIGIKIPKEIEVKIECGDFRKLIKEIPDNSVQLVLTDPPYPKEYLPLWEDLAKESARILKPGGFLVAYSGQKFIPEVIESLKKHLSYYWTMGLYHKGSTAQRFEVNMWNRWKPIFVFYKPPVKKQGEWFEDMVVSETQDKDLHEWGQSVEPFIKLAERFSLPGDIIVDPFLGGGSTIEACIEAKRNVIGYEIDKNAFEILDKRFNGKN